MRSRNNIRQGGIYYHVHSGPETGGVCVSIRSGFPVLLRFRLILLSPKELHWVTG